MAIIFCDIQGIVLKHLVPYKTTITGDYYSHLLCTQLRRAVREKRPGLYIGQGTLYTKTMRPHTHTSRVDHDTTRALGIELLPHPPYSPGLAICDFWLFPNMKDVLRGKKYESREELEVAITTTLRGMSRDGLEHVFRSWTERWQKCISSRGKYFEKL